MTTAFGQGKATEMSEATSSDELPTEILGRKVIGICPNCMGEGILWGCDDAVTTHWADRCAVCNCIGFILDIQGPAVSDQEDAPF